MPVKANDVKLLVEQAAAKAGLSAEYADFHKLSELINEMPGPEISARYLYENLYKRSQNALEKGEAEVGVRPAFADKVAVYLGYRDYRHFVAMQNPPADALLAQCVGAWYSYVRAHSGLPHLLRAPVRIWQEGSGFRMALHGPHRRFEGTIDRRGACLFAHLLCEPDKELHLVFKIGMAQSPAVLKGVFSGVSTSGDPIAGREILVRQADAALESLSNQLFDFGDPNWDSAALDPRILGYFREFQGSYLKISHASTFTLDDLLLEK